MCAWLQSTFALLACMTGFMLSSPSQVFVANPNKTKAIQDILLKNQDKLVEFLSKFHSDRTGKVAIGLCHISFSTYALIIEGGVV